MIHVLSNVLFIHYTASETEKGQRLLSRSRIELGKAVAGAFPA